MNSKDISLLLLLYHTAQMSEESRQELGALITRIQVRKIFQRVDHQRLLS